MDFCWSLWYLWFVMGILAVLLRLLVPGFRSWLESWKAFKFLRVPELHGMQENHLYKKVSTYVGTLNSTINTEYVNLYGPKNSNEVFVSLEDGQTVQDVFLGVRVWWIHEIRDSGDCCTKSFVLKIHKNDRKGILGPYMQHVQAVAEDFEHRRKELKLYANCDRFAREKWMSAPFKNPANFDTIAFDLETKNKIRADLDVFAKGKNFYHRIGRAWKRGYLFYGSTGTGKTSMIAAMANYLHYDVYELELGKVNDASDLRMLLMQTSNKSILVVKDVDCIDSRLFVADDHKGFSGSFDGSEDGKDNGKVISMVNFIDCFLSIGEERIVVFTATSKDKLDSALFKPARIDMQVHFPFCTFPAFLVLVNNYLCIQDHKHFPLVEEAFKGGCSLTPAEVGDILLVNKSSPSRALKALVSALQQSSKRGIDASRKLSAIEYDIRSPQTDHSRQLVLKDTTNSRTPIYRDAKGSEIVLRSPKDTQESFLDIKKLQNIFRLKSKKNWELSSSPLAKDS